jgi:hypothetical protein
VLRVATARFLFSAIAAIRASNWEIGRPASRRAATVSRRRLAGCGRLVDLPRSANRLSRLERRLHVTQPVEPLPDSLDERPGPRIRFGQRRPQDLTRFFFHGAMVASGAQPRLQSSVSSRSRIVSVAKAVSGGVLHCNQ